MTEVKITPETTSWPEPTTPLEALEIALQLARDEQRWVSGKWQEVRYTGLDDKNPACKNFRACSAGLLGMAVGDGALMKRVIRGMGTFSDAFDPYGGVGFEAARFLADALEEVAKDARDLLNDGYGVFYVDSTGAPLDRIIDMNDGPLSRHHDLIVKGFELAVEKARAAVVS